MLAPVFKESSAATTPSTAPSPMTLSRYDEWTGTFGTGNNQDANYGLYAFRNPNTAYQRAYWHPGIGIWQYDSAGLGAPLTTVEAMDVAGRRRPTWRADHVDALLRTATGSDQDRRYAAWRDWGFPCTLCQGFFDEMIGTDPELRQPQPGRRASGRSAAPCSAPASLAGVAGTTPCWYVEPRVGVIQGATAWATLSPDGGSGPTVAPAPLSHPFYVVDRGATEERHWMRVDTGYGIDIRAARTIGKNARPRSNQSGSGLTWSTLVGAVRPHHRPRLVHAGAPARGQRRRRRRSARLPTRARWTPTATARVTCSGTGPGRAADYLWIGAGGGPSPRTRSPSAPPTTTCSPVTRRRRRRRRRLVRAGVRASRTCG